MSKFVTEVLHAIPNQFQLKVHRPGHLRGQTGMHWHSQRIYHKKDCNKSLIPSLRKNFFENRTELPENGIDSKSLVFNSL